MTLKTTDLCDEYESLVRVAEPLFQDYGGVKPFWGQMVTVRVFEDNVLVRKTLETDGQQRVLVVDGGASTRCALLGDQLAQLAYENSWAGIVINGCIRDSAEITHINVGVKALATVPKKSRKEGTGERDVPVDFAGICFPPGGYLYADEDGIIVADRDLSQQYDTKFWQTSRLSGKYRISMAHGQHRQRKRLTTVTRVGSKQWSMWSGFTGFQALGGVPPFN